MVCIAIIEMENEVKGIVVNDENFLQILFVSNVDVYFTYLKLLNDDAALKNY